MRLKNRLALSAVGVIGLVYVALNDPSTEGHYPSCAFLSLTGFECPGCGATRCVHELLNGNFLGAIDFNVFAALAAPWLLWRYGMWMLGRQRESRPVDSRWIVALAVAVVSFGVLRNVDQGVFLYFAASE